MDGLLDVAAKFAKQATSGRPFSTDRERVEHHVRLAVGVRNPTLIWAENPVAATRTAADIMVSDHQQPRTTQGEGVCSGPLGLGDFWSDLNGYCGPRISRASLGGLDLGPSRLLVALADLRRTDFEIIWRGRAENRRAGMVSRRRLQIEPVPILEPLPSVCCLIELLRVRDRDIDLRDPIAVIEAEARGDRDGLPQPTVPACIRETAYAATAGLLGGFVYRVSGRFNVILVPRPTIRVRAGHFHAEERPAVEWPDGTGWWYWDGVAIPARIASKVGELTADQVAAISNPEVRRLVLERTGWERFLADPTQVAQDRPGTL